VSQASAQQFQCEAVVPYVWRNPAVLKCDIHGDFEIFQIAFVTPASAWSIAA